MDILAALRQEEAKLQKQADKVRQQLNAVRAARKILGREVAGGGKRIGRKKRVMSSPTHWRVPTNCCSAGGATCHSLFLGEKTGRKMGCHHRHCSNHSRSGD